MLLFLKATTVEGYLAKMMQNNDDSAKDALFRVAAFLHKIRHKEDSIEAILENLPHDQYPPPNSNVKSISSSLRFDLEVSFVAESISTILRENEFEQLQDSNATLLTEKMKQTSTSMCDILSSLDFQERSLDLLKSLMTISLLSKSSLRKRKKSPKIRNKLLKKKTESPKKDDERPTKEKSLLSPKNSPRGRTSLNVPKEVF